MPSGYAGLDAVGEGADRREVGEVEGLDVELGAAAVGGEFAAHLLDGLLALFDAAAGDDDRRALAGELPRGHQADAAVGTGDDRGLAALVRNVFCAPALAHAGQAIPLPFT